MTLKAEALRNFLQELRTGGRSKLAHRLAERRHDLDHIEIVDRRAHSVAVRLRQRTRLCVYSGDVLRCFDRFGNGSGESLDILHPQLAGDELRQQGVTQGGEGAAFALSDDDPVVPWLAEVVEGHENQCSGYDNGEKVNVALAQVDDSSRRLRRLNMCQGLNDAVPDESR
jgi:hypothetical protein